MRRQHERRGRWTLRRRDAEDTAPAVENRAVMENFRQCLRHARRGVKNDAVTLAVIGDHRQVIERVGDLDTVTEDLLIQQTAELERYHWFVRSHLTDWAGGTANAGASSELDAARAVAVKRSRNAPRYSDAARRRGTEGGTSARSSARSAAGTSSTGTSSTGTSSTGRSSTPRKATS